MDALLNARSQLFVTLLARNGKADEPAVIEFICEAKAESAAARKFACRLLDGNGRVDRLGGLMRRTAAYA
jgi:hypothetical protein